MHINPSIPGITSCWSLFVVVLILCIEVHRCISTTPSGIVRSYTAKKMNDHSSKDTGRVLNSLIVKNNVSGDLKNSNVTENISKYKEKTIYKQRHKRYTQPAGSYFDIQNIVQHFIPDSAIFFNSNQRLSGNAEQGSHLSTSSDNGSDFNQVKKRQIRYNYERERNLPPHVRKSHAYHRKSHIPNARYSGRPQGQLFTTYRKHKSTINGPKFLKENERDNFYKKPIFKRVKNKSSRQNMSVKHSKKNSVESRLEKSSKKLAKTHTNSVVHTKDITSLDHQKGNDNSNGNGLGHWKSEVSPTRYRSDNNLKTDQPKEAKKGDFIRNKTKYDTPLNYASKKKVSNAENGLYKRNLTENNVEAFEKQNDESKLNDDLPTSNSVVQNETFPAYKSGNKNDFIVVQVFGDFLKNDMLDRSKKESMVKELIPRMKRVKNQRTKRQEALFIIIALFGVTVVILSVACIALIITRKRNKGKKAKEPTVSSDKMQEEKGFEKTVPVSLSQLAVGPAFELEKENKKKKSNYIDSVHTDKIKEQMKMEHKLTTISRQEYFYSDLESESEDVRIEPISRIRRARHTRSLPNNACKSYKTERKLYKDLSQILEPEFESKIVDKMDFDKEYENVTEADYSRPCRDQLSINRNDSDYSIDNREENQPKELQREFSCLSLNLEENTLLHKTPSVHYDMGYLQEDCKYEDEESEDEENGAKSIIKQELEICPQVTPQIEEHFLSNELGERVSSERFEKCEVGKLERIESELQQDVCIDEDSLEYENDGKSKFTSSSNSEHLRSTSDSNKETIEETFHHYKDSVSADMHREDSNKEIIEETFHHSKDSVSADMHREVPIRAREKRIGSPWSRILSVKPQSVLPHDKEIDGPGYKHMAVQDSSEENRHCVKKESVLPHDKGINGPDYKPMSVRDSSEENGQCVNFTKCSGEKDFSRGLFFRKSGFTQEKEIKKDQFTKNHPWKHLIKNINKCPGGKFTGGKNVVINNFRP